MPKTRKQDVDGFVTPFGLHFIYDYAVSKKTSKKLWGIFSSFWAYYKLNQKKIANTFGLYLHSKKKGCTFALPIGKYGTENDQRGKFRKTRSRVLWHDEESNKIVRLRRYRGIFRDYHKQKFTMESLILAQDER